MIKQLREADRLDETAFMALLFIFCFGTSLFRRLCSGTWGFFGLNWNLFLAFVPWALTSITFIKPRLQNSIISITALLVFWLLFFPNAPYIITDLFHLRAVRKMPDWYDTLMILSYAWTGLLFGFLSLWDIERILGNKLPQPLVTVFSGFFLFVGSFGIYIGRYLRWNSWDFFTRTSEVLTDIGDRFSNPFEHLTTWGVTLFMGTFLNVVYWSFRMIKRRLDRLPRS
ncbi:membrane protein [Spirochaetia bacterium]|nr:membrane protein [Spirochaetia bacterium]